MTKFRFVVALPLRAAFCLVLGATLWRPAGAQVYLNEITAQGDEFVEIYNRGPGPVPLTGWRIDGSPGGSFPIPGGTMIAAGQYLVFDTPGDIFPNAGGEVAIIDVLNAKRDQVTYGQLGSAPLPGPYFPFLASVGPSLARAPDASLAVPPVPNPLQDGLYWTLDETPTFGFINDAPIPRMGHTIVLNELDPAFDGGPDQIELFNPNPSIANLVGWYVTNGDRSFLLPPTTILPYQFAAFTLLPGYELEAYSLVYLFDNLGTRVDQLGFLQAPFPHPGDCYGRCRDGIGPNLGFEWNSSGGFVSFFPAPCTIGAPNAGPVCDPPTSVGDSWDDRARLEVRPSLVRADGCVIECVGFEDADALGHAARQLEIVDVRGRVVRTLPLLAEDGRSVRWDGRLRDGLAARSGVYWVRESSGRVKPVRLVVLR